MLWVAYLCSIGMSPESTTWVNIDETAIPYHVGGRAGMRAATCPKELQHLMVEKATLRQKRSHCTFLAAIARNHDEQKHLPQVLLPNIKGHKKKWQNADVLKKKPDNIEVIDDTGGWSTNVSMRQYVKILKRALDKAGKKKVVLVMDCHPSHYAFRTLQFVRRQGWQVLLIPSKLTYLLQPLDAYVFSKFKHKLHEAHAKCKIETKGGSQSFDEWLETTISCIHTFFNNADMRQSFEKCGHTESIRKTSARVTMYADEEIAKKVRKLTVEELHEYIGMKKEGIHRLLFATPIPVHMQDMHLHIHAPTHRLIHKTSSAHM